MRKVLKAQINAHQRNSNGGCTVEFNSMENIQLESIVFVRTEDRRFNFNVNSISVNDDNSLRIVATETGYWGSKIDRLKDFDIRNLIGLEVQIETDEEKIKNLRQSSTYC